MTEQRSCPFFSTEGTDGRHYTRCGKSTLEQGHDPHRRLICTEGHTIGLPDHYERQELARYRDEQERLDSDGVNGID